MDVAAEQPIGGVECTRLPGLLELEHGKPVPGGAGSVAQAFGDLYGAVGAAVCDDDDVDVDGAPLGEEREQARRHPGLLVVSGDDNVGYAGQPGGHDGLASGVLGRAGTGSLYGCTPRPCRLGAGRAGVWMRRGRGGEHLFASLQ